MKHSLARRPLLHAQVTADLGWAGFWTMQTVMEGGVDGGEEREGGQDVLIGTPCRKRPLGSRSLARSLTSHHIL